MSIERLRIFVLAALVAVAFENNAASSRLSISHFESLEKYPIS